MPLTPAGIFYADDNTPLSVADISAAMATSVSSAVGITDIIQSVMSSNVTVSSNSSYSDIGLTATITPSSADSKILILMDARFQSYGGANSVGAEFQIVRDDSKIITYSRTSIENVTRNGFLMYYWNTSSINHVDNPGKSAPVKYTVKSMVASGFNASNTVYAGSKLILMEIGK